MARYSLTINGVSFGERIIEGGVVESTIERCVSEVTTLDGTLHRNYVSKKQIMVTCCEMSTDTLSTLQAALATSPATVSDGSTSTSYHVTAMSYSRKTVVGNKTYVSGFTFTLLEV